MPAKPNMVIGDKPIYREFISWCRVGCCGTVLETAENGFIAKTSKWHVQLPNKCGNMLDTLQEAKEWAAGQGYPET